jgi:hypothetical protein
MFRSTATGMPIQIADGDGDGELRMTNGPKLTPRSKNVFGAGVMTLEVPTAGKLLIARMMGVPEAYERTVAVVPGAADLGALVGTYTSDEAETTFEAVVEAGSLVLKRSPDTTLKPAPACADAFTSPVLGGVIFRRGASGKVTGFSITQDRVWDLPLQEALRGRFDR